MTHDLRPGLHVYSHAGVAIGVIAAVRGDVFQVNAPRRPDCWVHALDIIAETHGHDGVMLRPDAKHCATPDRVE